MPYSIEFLEDRDVPIQGVVSGGKLNYYNTRTKELSFLKDWADGESSRGSGGRNDLSISNARFGPIVDATRNRFRYTAYLRAYRIVRCKIVRTFKIIQFGSG